MNHIKISSLLLFECLFCIFAIIFSPTTYSSLCKIHKFKYSLLKHNYTSEHIKFDIVAILLYTPIINKEIKIAYKNFSYTSIQ